MLSTKPMYLISGRWIHLVPRHFATESLIASREMSTRAHVSESELGIRGAGSSGTATGAGALRYLFFPHGAERSYVILTSSPFLCGNSSHTIFKQFSFALGSSHRRSPHFTTVVRQPGNRIRRISDLISFTGFSTIFDPPYLTPQLVPRFRAKFKVLA
jgi:hypothetical protein